MIELYYWTTPNGHKITMFMEESGIDYEMKLVDIRKGEQFNPEFLSIAPNNRIPALVDDDPAGQGIESVRVIRDEIKSRVEKLLAELLD